jgi:Fe-S cluster assembly protein SufD
LASPATAPEWLAARRERAAALSEELELPTTRTKGWEFTDLTSLDFDGFPAVAQGEGEDAAADAVTPEAAPLQPGEAAALELAQVDGMPLGVPAEAAGEGAPIVLPLSVAVERHPDLVQAHLGSIVAGDDPFVARNDAGWTGGLFVYVPRNTTLEAPVFATATQSRPATALNWRTLIVLEEGAEAEVWEQYRSAQDDTEGLFNTVVELRVGQNAKLRFVNAQALSEKSWVFGSQRAEVERDGALEWVSLGFGSARGKVRMETKLAGQGSSARVTGAYAGHARQHLDFDTTQEHAAPQTTSDLAFRGVLRDRATAVWRGMIVVDPGAQQTDAFQESRNLLLSKKAHADAIPGLEIQADDVRCTHAAAIAQVDKEQLFYLESRGLDREGATRLVIDGFMQELVERFGEGPVRERLAGALERRLEAILDE